MAPNPVRPRRVALPVRGATAVLLLMIAAAGSTGCYHYVPVGPEVAKKGDPVRAYVQGASVEVADLAVRNVATVDGEFIAATDQEVRLSATWLTTENNREFNGLHYTVALNRQHLRELMVKRLDRPKTLLASAGMVGGAILLHTVLTFGGSEGEGGGGGGGPIK